MCFAGKVSRDGEAIMNAVPPRPREDRLVAGPARREGRHIVPEKAGEAPLARAVNRIAQPEAALVEPLSPFFGIIVDAQPLSGSGEKIDMMAEREPGASHARAGFEQYVHKGIFARDRHHIGG